MARASSRLMAALYGEGSITARTRSGPRASTATASVNAESMPPDNPIKTPGKRFFST